eukprot:s1184_g19.t2
MNYSIPVITTCSGVEIGPKKMPGHSEEDVAIHLSLNIGIPVKELLAALSSFQLPSSPAPVDVPNCSFSVTKPRLGDKLPGRTESLSSGRWEGVPEHVGPRVVLGGGVDATTSTTSTAAVLAPTLASRQAGLTVKVSNISRRVTPDELQQVFEQHVGPVIDINVIEDTARLTFSSQESARKAIDEYDGGILEASKNEASQFGASQFGPGLILHPRSASSSLLEERLGPLSRCHLRRGEGWITIFQTAIIKQLKKEDGMNQIDYKGSFIEVCFDAPSDPLSDSFGSFGFVGDRAAHLAALAAEFGERLELMAEDLHPSVMNLKETFQVVRKPMVAVRSQPSTEGQIVFSVEYGTEVDTFGVDSSGLWRRVFCQCTRVAKQDAPLPREPVEAWMMEEHPSLGPLLRLLH